VISNIAISFNNQIQYKKLILVVGDVNNNLSVLKQELATNAGIPNVPIKFYLE